MYGVASQKHYIGQVHCFGALCTAMHWCTKFNTLVHLFSAVTRTLVTSCFVFKFWTMLFLIKISFPKKLFLCIFSFILSHLLWRTISLISKKWNRISEVLLILRKAPSENFESIWLRECLTFTQLKNVVRRVACVYKTDMKLIESSTHKWICVIILQYYAISTSINATKV